MKTIYFIGGTMGVGKTTVCQRLKQELTDCVFLDGDWCWDANPFQVNEETKTMVLENICFLLNQFIHCSAYQTILFCWVMHEQEIIDAILEKLDTADCKVKTISLLCSEQALRDRLLGDVRKGIRQADVIERSVQRLPLYQGLNTKKIDTSGRTVEQIVREILLA
ncbi:MAG: AAA family ATPase [Clostridiales bacterium]|nr:AAA family ATPase [Clostridiales bacterium]